MVRGFVMPCLEVDLTHSTVVSRIWRLLPATVSVQRGDRTLATAPVTATSGMAAPRAALADATGRPVPIEAGDTIVLDFTQPPAGGSLSMTVPELTLDYDMATQRIFGRATQAASIRFTHERLYDLPRLTDKQLAPGIRDHNLATVESDADGNHEVVYPYGADIRPGALMTTILRMPIGHAISRGRVVPLVSVHLGTGEACVVGEPGDRVDLELGDLRGTGSTSATIDWTRGLQTFLRTASGFESIARSGLRVRGSIGDLGVETRLDDIVLQSIELEIDSPHVSLGFHAVGPAGRDGYGRVRSSHDCAGDAFLAWAQHWSPADEDPTRPGSAYARFDVSAGGRWRESGLWRYGVELYFETDQRHRQYIVAYPFPPLEIHVDTDLVTGHMTRGEALELTLRTAGGTVRSVARAVAGGANRLEVRLRDAMGRKVSLHAGDVLEIVPPAGMWACVDGSNAVPIEPLGFDFSLAGGLTVSAPPDRPVAAEFTLVDGSVVELQLQSDGHGRIVLAATPERSPWRLDQVRAVRLVLDTPSGHWIVAEGEIDPGLATPIPDRPLARAWLPLCSTDRP